MSKDTPTISESEARTQCTFRALMWALSHPGSVQPLLGNGLGCFGDISEALLDLETSYYTPDPALGAILGRRGAGRSSPDVALYQFYSTLGAAHLKMLEDAPVGDHECPDRSATLIIGCRFGAGSVMRWHGPGIKGSILVAIGGIPEAFWSLRERMIRYPLGWDAFLVSNNQVIGLPRTTKVEVD